MAKALASWRESTNLKSIKEFVQRVTDPAHADFVPPAQRVATFDNDGTLWCEKPVYTQVYAALAGFAQRAKADPTLRDRQPFKAAYDGDNKYFAKYSIEANLPKLERMLAEAMAGETQAEFEARSAGWFETARHPRFGRLFKEMTYAPMIQLIGYLRAHEFQVFMCTGSSMDLMRIISDEIYGLSRDTIIGSSLMLEWQPRSDGPVLVRAPAFVKPINDGPGKPVNIQRHVGRPPILVAGNSNGDIEMMQFAAASGLPYLNLLVHHDDGEREYAYDVGAEKALALCAEHGWSVISMANDWHTIFR